MAIQLQQENEAWIKAFIKKHKRKPRILHISNVANNAYNNAKLLTDCGLENHVLAYNDCYAMGCPEWEDAYFTDEVKDMWHPDWFNYNLHGFCRPRWFAQGELNSCIAYLQALCDGQEEEADALFTILSQQNKSITPPRAKRPKQAGKILLMIALMGWRAARKVCSIIDSRFNRSTQAGLMRIKAGVYARLHPQQDVSLNTTQEMIYGKWAIDDRLIEEFKQEFPDRPDKLSDKDFINYYFARPNMRNLMDSYDIVMAYAVEGFYPLMFGKPYFAFEHGTIRDIPYADDAQGRICALTYRKATHTFVTNFDCVPSAKFLSPGKFSVINHPYDEDQSLSISTDWQRERDNLMKELQADMILFHPTRQDWVAGTGYADKANDRFLQAFASLRQQGLRLGLVCCEWGANVEQSKKLLADFDLVNYVRWVNPMGVIAYTRMCMIADMVVDQFKLGGFGGVTFKAMAAGAPVMAYVNVEHISARYVEPPPVINCQTETEITQQLTYWYSRMDELKKFGLSGRAWMKKFHNQSETVNVQLEQFRRHFKEVFLNGKTTSNLQQLQRQMEQ